MTRAALACLLATCLYAAGAQAASLRIEGIKDEMLANVQAYIGPPEETGRMSFRTLARHAEEQATAALQALGYYHPRYTVARRGKDDNPVCVLTVDPGPPVRIEHVDIRLEGDTDPRELRAFVERYRPKEGDVFHHGHYESFKSRLLQQALMLGYFNAAWTTQQVRVDDEHDRADIALAMALGPRFRLGETTVKGDGISPALVAKFPRFHAGDWYDASKIAELHRDLVRTGWFENVRIRAEPTDATDLAVPVGVEYEPRKKNRVGVGAGFSTDVGPRLQLQLEKPWLNAAGHSFTSYFETSKVRTQVEASYIVPLSDPVTSQLAYTYGLQFEHLNDHNYWLTTAGIEHRKRLAHEWHLVRALDVERETDDFHTYVVRTTLLMPGVTLSRTESEGTPLVTRGWRVSTKLQVASEQLLSDANMQRFTLDTKAIQSLGDRFRVIGRGSLGAMGTDNINTIPVSLRFFAGGDQSVRGFNYESIGPRDAGGNLVGGRYLATGSLETDFRFAEHWLVAAFGDRGSAFDSSSDAVFHTGAGAGIRWLSPIGPLRLDFAWGVDEPQRTFNIHFYMGPEL